MTEDIRYLKKNIKTGNIDVHPTEKALIVNYEMQATIFGETGYAMGGDRKECQKIIRVKNLDRSTNIPRLAQEIIENCKLIQPNKLPEIEHLLAYLLNRKEVAPSEARSKSSGKLADPGAFDSTEIDEVANLNEIDNYLELLYDEISDKLRASALILQLARNPDNLEELYDNGILIGAIARVLNEDWKESTDLATNIIYIFFCFSSFSNFHQIIIHFKIGALTMNIIDHELKKADLWMDELQKLRSKNSPKLEATLKKYETNIRKQEQLFRVSYYLLLNIAEDVNLEVKMLSKNLIEMLSKTLERKNSDLLILVVSFLKKLSIYQDNLTDMLKHRVVERLSKHINNTNLDLLSITLRLLLNLSFNSELRVSMVKSGLLSKLVHLSQSPENGNVALCILYNISCEDRFKPYFLKTDCIPFLMKMILENQPSKESMEVIGLAINLVCDETIAKLVSDGKGLRMLMKKAYKTRDYMLMKMLRNISQHDGDIKMRFVDYLSDLVEVITDTTGKFEHSFIVECVGILSNLTIADLDFELILKEFNLVEWIKLTLLNCKNDQDDLLLEVIMLVGTIANDDNCAKLIADAGIIQLLIDLITAKQEDDEIVCQIVYVFYQLIFHESTRKIIIEETQAPAFIIDLMHDKNTEIRKVCDWTLDIISEFDEEWANKIRHEKFKWFNSQWLEMIESGGSAGYLDPEEDPASYLYDSGGLNYPFDASTADELLSRYGMLMSAGIVDRDGVPIEPMGSPNMEAGGIYTDEFGRPMYMGGQNYRGYSGTSADMPFERPDNQPGFRSDMGNIEHSMLYPPGHHFTNDDMENDNDEDETGRDKYYGMSRKGNRSNFGKGDSRNDDLANEYSKHGDGGIGEEEDDDADDDDDDEVVNSYLMSNYRGRRDYR